MQLRFWSPHHRTFVESLLVRIQDYYGPRLVSLAIFGSYARQENRANSDLDLLIVLDATTARGRLAQTREFVEQIELPLEAMATQCGHDGVFIEVSPLILSREAAGHFLPLYLDMIDAHLLIVDHNHFLSNRLAETHRQRDRWGSRRREVAGHWYWEIRPGMQWGDIHDYDE